MSNNWNDVDSDIDRCILKEERQNDSEGLMSHNLIQLLDNSLMQHINVPRPKT